MGAEELADELWSPTAASLAAASRLNRAANYRQKTWPRLAVCCCVNNQFLGCFFFLCCRVSGEWPKLCWWRSGVGIPLISRRLVMTHRFVRCPLAHFWPAIGRLADGVSNGRVVASWRKDPMAR